MADENETPQNADQTVSIPADKFQEMLDKAAAAGAAAHAQSVSAAPARPVLTGELVDTPATLLEEGDHLDHAGMVDKFAQMYPTHPRTLHKVMASAIQSRNPIALAYAHAGLHFNDKDGLKDQELSMALNAVQPHWLAVYPPSAPEAEEMSENDRLRARIEQLESMFRQAFGGQQQLVAG